MLACLTSAGDVVAAGLAEQAARLELDTVALTDRDGVYGAPSFFRAATARGLRPLVGACVVVEDVGEVRLLCESRAGYANLCRLLTEAHSHTRSGRERRAAQPSVPVESLAGRSAGLICFSGCAARGPLASAWRDGDLARAEGLARNLAAWFGQESFRIELQRPYWRHDRARNRWLKSLAGRLGLATVATEYHLSCRARSGWSKSW